MDPVSRRRFLATGGAAAAALTFGGTAGAAGLDRALRETRRRAIAPAGTTLETVATQQGNSGYRTLTAGPGWPLVTRTDLSTGASGRDDRRRALASFVQFTDIHIVDAQSPMRFEYLHPFTGSAHRPHETLTTQGGTSLVRRVNSLTTGPFTGRAPDFVVCTGDNTDNHERIELDWYLSMLSGGTIVPNTGNAGEYEGVQNSGATLYWNPGNSVKDMYKDKGFPYLPHLLSTAIQQFESPGLRIPWYAVFGNHDDSVSGTLPPGLPFVDAIYTGTLKLEGLSSSSEAEKLAGAMRENPRAAADALPHLDGPIRVVAADERRKPFTPKEFVSAHLADEVTGKGPFGHGFSERNVEENSGYYTFPIAEGVVGISMDSTCRAGFVNGAIGTAQFEWIERVLTKGSSRYYDSEGKLVKQDASDTYFLLFSHHTSDTMDNGVPDPERLFEKRHTGAELLALLHRFPNVLAWVNGHTHRNEISPRPGDRPEQGFWEINTASHVDYPHHARIIELADNGDGTLSLFTTLIEAESPYETNYADTSPRGLASLYRELAYNDIHRDQDFLGAAKDHNTELLLTDPLGARKSGR
ncbi:TIGR03767 family metallophosphoesterase [Sciscionella sediminilitoris]|uniref:TIGR03767 family metallophosphoesterase n=1 Tax=Sciscionella sediminilitoris TaxID=1445613 RepID=UPI00055BB6E2|nr:TIGR03767 family metallophosphoesterase [Sciscionella sp. SE31]